LLLHLLIILLFILAFEKVVFSPPSSKEQKITLNLSRFVPPMPAVKPVVTPPLPSPLPLKPPVPQPIAKKPVKKIITPVQTVKKKLLDDKKRLFVEKKEREENNVTKVTPRKKIVKKQFQRTVKKRVKKRGKKKSRKKKIRKRIVKHTKSRKKQKRSKDPLANALMGSGTSMYPTRRVSTSGSYVNRMIKQLYGREFNTFSPAQKQFIKENLGSIHRITQRTLTRNGYPDIALRTQQQGTNVVTFYLHPNGNITGLRLKRRIGYTALDQNTLDVIRIAYKDYPRPKSKTKITFYVRYRLQ